MIDKLVIRFIKLERALVAQQLEIKASNNIDNKYEDNHVLFHQNGIDFADDAVWISKSNSPRVAVRMFDSNDERDEYLEKVVKWISEELFTIEGKLEVGKMCEVASDGKNRYWNTRELLAVLPESYYDRYITNAADSKTKWSAWTYARPINSCVQPERDCGVFTWEKPGVNNKIKI